MGCEAHRSLARKAARAGTVLVKQGGALPLASSAEQVSLIELSSQRFTGVGAAHAPSRIARLLSNRLPTLASHIVYPAADFAANCEALSGALTNAGIVILVTRNAHAQPAHLRLAQFIRDRASAVILICAGNPYDAGKIIGADSVICTNGDSVPSLEAAVDALCGDYRPSGKLTVEI